jgi:hypothetical protein
MRQLVYAGLAGGRKRVPASVAEHPQVFATLTAPSFGPVHTRRDDARPCRCGKRHDTFLTFGSVGGECDAVSQVDERGRIGGK